MADPGRQTMFRLADRLGKTIAEIEAMAVEDFIETLAYYSLKGGLPDGGA